MSSPTIEYVKDAAELVSTWQRDSSSSNLYVGVDIGGTNTRVALGNDDTFEIIAQFKCDSTRAVVSGLKAVAERLESIIDVSCIKAACLDAAGRVCLQGTRVEITNYREGDEHRVLELSELPSSMFPRENSRIINDLESACYGISGLNAREKVNEYFKILMGPNDEAKTPRLHYEHYLVVAVGTGMGVGLLMALPEEEDFVVLPLEGGHILLSAVPPQSGRHDVDIDLHDRVSQSVYGGEHALEYEDLVSGRGLEALYNYFASTEGDDSTPKSLPADQISKLAGTGNAIAERALWYHYAYLAQGTANLAVCTGAKGVFWAGDNQIANGEFVDKIAKDLSQEFLNHPKRAWLEPLPIYAQTKKFNVNLEGTITVSRMLAKRGPIAPRLHFDPSECSGVECEKISDRDVDPTTDKSSSSARAKAPWTLEAVIGTAIVSALVATGVTYLFCKEK